MVWGLAAVGLLVLGAAPGPSAGPAVARPPLPTATAGLAASNIPEGAFLRWATELARAKKLSVCRAGQLQYPGERAGYFAMLGRDEPHNQPDAIWVFGQEQVHWSFTPDPIGHHSRGVPCVSALGAARIGDGELRGIGARYMWDTSTLHRRRRTVILRRSTTTSTGASIPTGCWRPSTIVEHDPSRTGTDGRERPRRARRDAAGVALDQELEDADVRSIRREEPSERRGRRPGSLCGGPGKAGVQVVVDITDDLPVPTAVRAPARKFIRSDHLEIWWRPYGASANRQLGIGLRGDGTGMFAGCFRRKRRKVRPWFAGPGHTSR